MSNGTGTAEARSRHTLRDLYHERTHFEFIDRSWRWAILSGTLILISLIAFVAGGLNLGIDFEGGTQFQFTVQSGTASVNRVRDALAPVGLGDAKVLIVGNDSVRVQAKSLKASDQAKVTDALAKEAGITAADVSVTNVGPTWGQKVSSKALQALGVFFIAIALYLTFRFEWRMALAALIAVVHDIAITVGVYAVTGFEVTPATVVAFLTILGFSLYDTVVVFDKVKDNQARLGTVPSDTYSKMVNRSMNQVLMRSINTSIVALLPVGSLLFVGSFILGGLTLRDFALALFIGLLTGAYSSIFVATPILAWLKEHEPRYQALRGRAAQDEARRSRSRLAAPASPDPSPAADDDTGDELDAVPDADTELAGLASNATPAAGTKTPAGGSSGTGGTRGPANPRPRQQRRRKRR